MEEDEVSVGPEYDPSLPAQQAQGLSCVESLCCYQHGQSGCSRLAQLLEQMTGPCPAAAGADRCSAANHSSSSSSSNNRSWSNAENFYSNDRSILTLSPMEASHC
ncbi:putative phospholipid-transporting ATPase IF [Merluccius polli]|uniref:Phospholipid-transporting ATPase IF n=1 Tax=Merluccius polli TaxID=89951 RepID=A0AA47N6Z9_MERPO|nr:putative phospholipid-transporting ATPase IF [Merluccius polli]